MHFWTSAIGISIKINGKECETIDWDYLNYNFAKWFPACSNKTTVDCKESNGRPIKHKSKEESCCEQICFDGVEQNNNQRYS